MKDGIYFSNGAVCANSAFAKSVISEIIPGKLYLSSLEGAQNLVQLSALNITHVLNLSGRSSKKHKGIDYLSIRVDDGSESLHKHFDLAIDFINQGQTVLVHCLQGVSRSASVVIAYLMQEQGAKYADAKALVKRARPQINPHFNFKVQLLALASQLEQEHTTTNHGYWLRKRPQPYPE